MTFHNIVALSYYNVIITEMVNDPSLIPHTAIFVHVLCITWVEDLLDDCSSSYLIKSQTISRWLYSSFST